MERMQAVDAALDRVADRMTPIIRSRAIDAGWPKEVAARLSSVRTPTGIGVHVDKEVQQEAEDLEFGSPTSSPRSILTSFHSPKMKQDIEKIAGNSMDELLDRMRGMFS